eukprot:CAMPEP_0180434772 /NCGR_PEP_ID=MMETSP1036_2-20121128/10129_1 /TAXON_ID=632150 /ORGANISM="Azadinium spinosum, Strain 3D9" /LENGTH=60 /DNA_ID=CAMNT_0022440659 /DNA_START=326 /DNA_END=508 /DNA_ORIENTATION=+
MRHSSAVKKLSMALIVTGWLKSDISCNCNFLGNSASREVSSASSEAEASAEGGKTAGTDT